MTWLYRFCWVAMAICGWLLGNLVLNEVAKATNMADWLAMVLMILLFLMLAALLFLAQKEDEEP